MKLTERGATQSRFQRLRHRQIASIRQRSLHKSILNAEVFESVMETCICHVNSQLLENFGLSRIEIEPHFTQPFERFVTANTVSYKPPGNRSFVNEFVDQMFEFFTTKLRLLLQYGIGQNVEGVFDLLQDLRKCNKTLHFSTMAKWENKWESHTTQINYIQLFFLINSSYLF